MMVCFWLEKRLPTVFGYREHVTERRHRSDVQESKRPPAGLARHRGRVLGQRGIRAAPDSVRCSACILVGLEARKPLFELCPFGDYSCGEDLIDLCVEGPQFIDGHPP